MLQNIKNNLNMNFVYVTFIWNGAKNIIYNLNNVRGLQDKLFRNTYAVRILLPVHRILMVIISKVKNYQYS